MTGGIQASESMLRRITLMARFIEERHGQEFAVYWKDNWPGKAQGMETLAYFKREEIIKELVIGGRIQ